MCPTFQIFCRYLRCVRSRASVIGLECPIFRWEDNYRLGEVTVAIRLRTNKSWLLSNRRTNSKWLLTSLQQQDQPKHEVPSLQAINGQARTWCRQTECIQMRVSQCCLIGGRWIQLKNKVCTKDKLKQKKTCFTKGVRPGLNRRGEEGISANNKGRMKFPLFLSYFE